VQLQAENLRLDALMRESQANEEDVMRLAEQVQRLRTEAEAAHKDKEVGPNDWTVRGSILLSADDDCSHSRRFPS
jgi:Tfp pilus assembly protein PilV